MIDTVKVTVNGPLFTGQAHAALDRYMGDMTETIAQFGHDMVQAEMSANFQNPTGYYQSRVVVERQTQERVLVHDSMVIYGPWLEGVGSRNATTRFKGYAHWRHTAQAVQGRALTMASQILQRYIGEMN